MNKVSLPSMSSFMVCLLILGHSLSYARRNDTPSSSWNAQLSAKA